CPGVAQVPGEVAGEHADQHVAADALFEAVEDRAQGQVVGLEVAEVPLDVFEVLVGADHAGCVQVGGGGGGAQHVDPIERGFGVDLGLTAGDGQAGVGDGDLNVLAGVVLVDHLAGGDPDLRRSGQPSRLHAGDNGGQQPFGRLQQVLALAG